MNYDLDFRYRRALQPDGLPLLRPPPRPWSTPCRMRAMLASIRPAIPPSSCSPATSAAWRSAMRLTRRSPKTLPLRRQCIARIDELKSKPALVALARRGIGYDPEAKRAFHREARSALRVAARHLGLDPDQYDLRSNFAGPAVSGEITLHGDEIYVQVSIPCIRPGREVMFRRCKGRQDYLGDRNHFCDIAVLAAPQSFRSLVVRETGLSINPREQSLL
jgi:hypothetical protein